MTNEVLDYCVDLLPIIVQPESYHKACCCCAFDPASAQCSLGEVIQGRSRQERVLPTPPSEDFLPNEQSVPSRIWVSARGHSPNEAKYPAQGNIE